MNLKQLANKRKAAFKHFFDDSNPEWRLIKKIVSFIFGGIMGIAYFNLSFANAFTREEKPFRDAVFWMSLTISSLSCAASSQCCCIATLCLPNMAAKSGRSALQAVITAWVLAGPITNIMYHSGEAIRSITCAAQLQSEQMEKLVHLLHSPVTAGFRAIVEESDRMNETEKQLTENLEELKEEIESNDPELGEEDEEDIDIASGDVAKKLRKDTLKRCEGVFTHGVDECKELFKKKEQDCHDTIKIPFIKHILCAAMKATFLCNVVGYFDRWCEEIPEMDSDSVNSNYSAMNKQIENVDEQFKTDMYWKVPEVNEKTAQLTVDEMAHQIQLDFDERKIIMDVCIALANKILAVTFVFVVTASASYSKSYLTDPKFENLYITSYFQRKDSERAMQNKRHILPLTKLEKKSFIFPLSLKLSLNERKSMVFRVATLTMQLLFTSLLFLFDYIVYLILDLINRHGRVDFHTEGHHRLNVFVGGNGTVAGLLQHVFKPYTNNSMNISSKTTNAHCLPVASDEGMKYMPQVYTGFAVLFFLITLDAYILRFRRLICALYYPRQEKRRIVFLYNDLLRTRKDYVQRVKETIKKLSRAYELNEKYSFLQALSLRFPQLKKFMDKFDLGKRKCLVCETKDRKKHPLVYCENNRCNSAYCTVCWSELEATCWVCENAEYANMRIEERMMYEQGLIEEEYNAYANYVVNSPQYDAYDSDDLC